MKNSVFRTYIKVIVGFKFLILWFVFNNIFDPKKDKLLFPVFASRIGMFNVIGNLALYLHSQGLNILLIYPGTIPFQYFKTKNHNIEFYSAFRWKPVYFSKVQWIIK